MEITSHILLSPVTALEFTAGYLLAGVGPYIHVYDIDEDRHLVSFKALPHQNIHGIQTDTNDQSCICVHGEKGVQVLKMSADKNCSFSICSYREFTDWVWTAQWLVDDTGKTTLALALGHNTIVHWDWTTDHVLQSVDCDIKCILYSAHFIGHCWDTLVLAAGTVFSEVVFWSPVGESNNDGRCKSFNRLSGHQGVIFAMDFRADIRKFCSVSDDRSIRLYDVTLPKSHDRHMITIDQWKKAEFVLQHELYGHSARVWRARLLEHHLVSVGEDVTCCVWNYEGQVVSKFKGHKGRGIWSLAVDRDEKLLATGGGDCSIRTWKLKQETAQKDILDLEFTLPELVETGDFAKVVTVRDVNHILVSSNNGCLLEYECSSRRWTCVHNDTSFKSYSVIGLWEDGSLIAYGNIHGDVIVFSTGSNEILSRTTICSGKVHNIICLGEGDDREMLISGPQGEMGLWQLKKDDDNHSFELCQDFILPICKQRWVTAAAKVIQGDYQYLVCGDRGGTVHLYSWTLDDHRKRNLQHLTPVQSFPKLHGKAGVSCVCCHDDVIYTAGRDGQYREYSLTGGRLEVMSASKVLVDICDVPPSGCVQGLEHCYTSHTGLGTFIEDLKCFTIKQLSLSKSYFIVWSVQQNQRLLEVDCGGGHRSWGFSMDQDHSVYACVKIGNVKVCRMKNDRRQTILIPCLHGRELTCSSFLAQFGNDHIFVTASEDTTINIVKVDRSGQLTILKSLHGHLSSVRALATCRTSTQGASLNSKFPPRTKPELSTEDDFKFETLLFTAGGRAQIKCWKISIGSSASLKVNECNSNNIDELLLLTSSKSENQRVCLESSQRSGEVSCKCELLHSCLLNSRGTKGGKPWKMPRYNPSPETRFMSLTALCATDAVEDIDEGLFVIGAACSDGYVRIFTFNDLSKTLHQISESSYHNHCVLCVGHVITDNNMAIMYSAATDGCIAFWDISGLLLEWKASGGAENQEVMCDISPVHVINIHQSGVNAVAVQKLQGGSILVVSGGDDNALHVNRLCITADGGFKQTSHASVLNAHATQITGVSFISDITLVSASIDQRLNVWDIEQAPDLTIKLVGSKFTNVADVACMETWSYNSGIKSKHVMICGVGLQWLTLQGLKEK